MSESIDNSGFDIESTNLDSLYALRKSIQDLRNNDAWGILVTDINAQVDRMQQDLIYGDVREPALHAITERLKGQIEGRLVVEFLLRNYEHMIAERIEQLTKENEHDDA